MAPDKLMARLAAVQALATAEPIIATDPAVGPLAAQSRRGEAIGLLRRLRDLPQL